MFWFDCTLYLTLARARVRLLTSASNVCGRTAPPPPQKKLITSHGPCCLIFMILHLFLWKMSSGRKKPFDYLFHEVYNVTTFRLLHEHNPQSSFLRSCSCTSWMIVMEILYLSKIFLIRPYPSIKVQIFSQNSTHVKLVAHGIMFTMTVECTDYTGASAWRIQIHITSA